MEITLLEGNNLIASYLLDKGNPAWEEKFRALKPRFHDWIATVRNTMSLSEDEEALLLRLEETWAELDARREEVIALGKKGEGEQAKSILLTEINGRLSAEAYDLCGQLITIHEDASGESIAQAGRRMRDDHLGGGRFQRLDAPPGRLSALALLLSRALSAPRHGRRCTVISGRTPRF